MSYLNNLSLVGQLVIILLCLVLILVVALVNLVIKRRSIVQNVMPEYLPSLLPEWLAIKIRNTPYEYFASSAAVWLDYARGNLLLATAGSIIALIGALLAASGLLLFGIVGAAILVVGLQIIYAAAQEAGVFDASSKSADRPDNSVTREKAF